MSEKADAPNQSTTPTVDTQYTLNSSDAQQAHEQPASQQINAQGIAGFVVALISGICFMLIPIFQDQEATVIFVIISLIASPIGLVFSVIGFKKSKRLNESGAGISIAGIAFSSISLLFGLIVIISAILFLLAIP